MADPLTACRSCGSTRFDVHESYGLTGMIDPDRPGIISVSSSSYGGVDYVQCAQCGATPDDYQLEFC